MLLPIIVISDQGLRMPHVRASVRTCAVILTGWILLSGQPVSGQGRIRLEATAHTTSDKLASLGDVIGAVIGTGQTVFLLDANPPRIVATDLRLRELASFGRQGSGPGEFRNPVSLAMVSGGRIAVLDRALRRITIVAATNGGKTIVLHRTMPLLVPAEAMCALPDDKFLVYGFAGGNRLHVLDSAGKVLRSFAPPRGSGSPMASTLLAAGLIACDNRRDEVVVSSKFLSTVEAFRISTGQLVWLDSLRFFRPLELEDHGTTVSISSSGLAGYSSIASLFQIGNYRVFQTVYEARQDHPTVDTVVTLVYDIHRAAWMPYQVNVPLSFRLTDTNVVSVDSGPQLELEIRLSRILFGPTPRN